jgi:hypothetical protein
MTEETAEPIGVNPEEDAKLVNVEQRRNLAEAQDALGTTATELYQIRPLQREQAVVVKPPVLKLMK